MARLFFHTGSHPDFFLIFCCAISVASAIVIFCLAKKRSHKERTQRT